ncbi:MAG: sporulation protein [Lachnospiraceae bacterium]|nr:sporulation protein [Lachnospiraceae bacterium]
MRSKKQKQPAEKSRKEKIVEKLMLPKDLMLGAAVVTVTGQTEVYIENYRGIIEYTAERIRLQTKTCSIEITGSSLNVGYYTNDEMKITGRISSINYGS